MEFFKIFKAIWFLRSEFLVCLMIYLQTELRYFSFTASILFRYYSFCQPERAKTLCTTSKAKYFLLTVSLFSLIYTIPIGLSHEWKWNPETNMTDTVKTDMGNKKTEIGKMYYKIYKTWMNFIIRFVIPSICLVTFNVLLLREVLNFISPKTMTLLRKEIVSLLVSYTWYRNLRNDGKFPLERRYVLVT